MELQVEDSETVNHPESSMLDPSTTSDQALQNGSAVNDASERSPQKTDEDEEAIRLKELAADVRDQTDLERNIGREVSLQLFLKGYMAQLAKNISGRPSTQ